MKKLLKNRKYPRTENGTAERRLRELQRAVPMEVHDLQDLRQPMLTMRRLDASEERFETFITYGTNQDPI